jgi:hypothetical protein
LDKTDSEIDADDPDKEGNELTGDDWKHTCC